MVMRNVGMRDLSMGDWTNCLSNVKAIARSLGGPLAVKDWETVGHEIPLLVNLQPAGHFLGEGYHRAGGVPAVFGELMRGGKIHTGALTVTGKTIGENYRDACSLDPVVIRSLDKPLKEKAGLLLGGLVERPDNDRIERAGIA